MDSSKLLKGLKIVFALRWLTHHTDVKSDRCRIWYHLLAGDASETILHDYVITGLSWTSTSYLLRIFRPHVVQSFLIPHITARGYHIIHLLWCSGIENEEDFQPFYSVETEVWREMVFHVAV
jgi:hypothetical protein